MVTGALAALSLPIVALVAHDLALRPTIRRLALRNVARRRNEALLVVAGSLLGTAIICASFVVGDTLRASIRDGARTRLGPVDVVVRVTSLERFAGVVVNLDRLPGVTDGSLRMISAPASVRRPGTDPRAEPQATLLEADFDAARQFGNDPGATGLASAGPTPTGNEAVIGRDLADRIGVGPGDTVDISTFGTSQPFRVRQVLPVVGLAGFGRPSVFVAPGTIRRASSGALDVTGVSPPDGLVLLSNPGGILSNVARATAATVAGVRAIIGEPPGVEVQTRKLDLVDRAEEEASTFTELFAGIGSFSVAAGILLLVNIFVMLADERRSELGMLRAVGMRRNHLVRAFGAEGAVYAAVAGVAGTAVGVAVGRVVVAVAEGVFNIGAGDRARVALRFSAQPTSLVSGLVIGGFISLATVWATSVRIGRLNVIRALRDLPDPRAGHRRAGALVVSLGGVVAGAALAAAGIAMTTWSGSWFGALAGPPLAVLSAVPLVRWGSHRAVLSGACGLTLVWGTVCVRALPAVFEGSGIPVFVVQGILLVSAAVTLGATNADVLGRAVGRLGGARRRVASRLAFAYPTARRFRTSMLLGMYALVVFVFVFLAVFAELFAAQGPRFTREASAGYDLIVDSSPSSPATVNLLLAQRELAAVAPIVRGSPKFSWPGHPDPADEAMSGFDRSFLDRGVPVLAGRDSRFATDLEAWKAVLDSEDLVVVSDTFLRRGSNPGGARAQVGDVLTATNPLTNDRRDFKVVGLLRSDFVGSGAVVSAPAALQFLASGGVTNRHYVAVERGGDPESVAALLTGRLVEAGIDARTIRSIVDDALAAQTGFIRLMQGYLALGLLVGVAGLGVVMVRAVRERRRQIGMLRAMGFGRRVVRAAFLLEAAFVAVEGVVFGAGLALVVSYQVLARSKVLGEADLPFTVPWLALTLVLAATVVASLAAAAVPAAQAARIRPAAALRIAE